MTSLKKTLLSLGLALPLSIGAFAFQAHAVSDDIQALADKWSQAYNAHNKKALASLYGEDAYLMMHGSPTIEGRKDIGDFWAKDFKEGDPITTLDVTHAIQGADMMLVHGDYRVLDRDDGTLLGEGRFAHIWMLGDDGKWKLDRDIWNEPFEPYSE
jgi:uncharacterized protein (TIGR02246 family)